jgi:hypothetical protein
MPNIERRIGPINSQRGINGGIVIGGSATLFTSANQTITAAGSLTIAHGLGAMPTLVQVRLKNTTAELGYSIGDEVVVNPHNTDANSNSQGVSIVPDATNLNIRYGSSSTTFILIRKDTGTGANITNANWSAIFYAWV